VCPSGGGVSGKAETLKPAADSTPFYLRIAMHEGPTWPSQPLDAMLGGMQAEA
jgi:hypothetical protein